MKPSSIKSLLVPAVLFSAALLSAISSSRAGVIYDDQFGRTGALSGSSPAPTNAPGSIWGVNGGSSGFQTNGSALNLAIPTSSDLATLSFNLSNPAYANSIVSLSVDISATTTGGGSWVGLGFTGPGGNIFSSTNGAVAWMIAFGNGTIFLNQGPSVTSNQTINGAFTPATTINARVDFNTAANTATFFLNNAQIGSPISFTSTPAAAKNVFLYNNQSTGTMDNFKLEVTAVPEPTTFASLSLGAAMLAMAFRRRK